MDDVNSRWAKRLSGARQPSPVVADPVGALLRRAAAGDEAAFAGLYDEVAPAVYGAVKRVVRNPAQADEVTQETFLDVWRTAARFDAERGSAMTWILTVAHRRAVDRVRSEESQQRRAERLRNTSAIDEAPISEVVIDELDRARVGKALDNLTPIQRQSVELAYFGGHTHAEISALLDLPLGTVKTRIRDGLIRLRDALEEGE